MLFSESTGHVCPSKTPSGCSCLDVVLPPCCKDGLPPIATTFAMIELSNASPLPHFSARVHLFLKPEGRKEHFYLYQSRVCLSHHYVLSGQISSGMFYSETIQSFQGKGTRRAIISPLNCLQNNYLLCVHLEHIVCYSTSAIPLVCGGRSCLCVIR